MTIPGPVVSAKVKPSILILHDRLYRTRYKLPGQFTKEGASFAHASSPDPARCFLRPDRKQSLRTYWSGIETAIHKMPGNTMLLLATQDGPRTCIQASIAR